MASERQRIGPMRHRIAIQSRAETADDIGGATYTWGTDATVWAHARALGAGEIVRQGGVLSDVGRVEFTIRHRTGVRQGQRVVWDSRNYYITAAPNPDARKRFLTLICDEREVG